MATESAKAKKSTQSGRAQKKQTAKPRSSSAKKTKAKPEKDPRGGLTAEGRRAFAQKEGSHLRPGVRGPADTPEKMRRKGSFLRRHFANTRGPMQKEGSPTRLALSAHAWGEPVPKSEADAKALAKKGKKLLEKYHKAIESEAAKTQGRNPARNKHSR